MKEKDEVCKSFTLGDGALQIYKIFELLTEQSRIYFPFFGFDTIILNILKYLWLSIRKPL